MLSNVVLERLTLESVRTLLLPVSEAIRKFIGQFDLAALKISLRSVVLNMKDVDVTVAEVHKDNEAVGSAVVGFAGLTLENIVLDLVRDLDVEFRLHVRPIFPQQLLQPGLDLCVLDQFDIGRILAG